jgi:hypothetical protein
MLENYDRTLLAIYQYHYIIYEQILSASNKNKIGFGIKKVRFNILFNYFTIIYNKHGVGRGKYQKGVNIYRIQEI